MFALHPDRSRLNPKFDGYKLDPISSEDAVSRYALQHKATQASVSGRHHFSFQEAQSRIRHNHLSVSPDAEHAVYIDENLRAILIRLDHVRVYRYPCDYTDSIHSLEPGHSPAVFRSNLRYSSAYTDPGI